MTRDDIIRLAREAYMHHLTWDDDYIEGTERFAALVAAHERKALTQACALLSTAFVKAEREACAKMVDHILMEGGGTYGDAIRARGARE